MLVTGARSPLFTDSVQMIAPPSDFPSAPEFCREFTLDQAASEVLSAVLSITARGLYSATLNGAATSPAVLTPGWTSYEKYLNVEQLDVAALLTKENSLRVVLGNGWHRGRIGFLGSRDFYGSELGLLAELVIEYRDGFQQRLGTDEQWTIRATQIVANDLLDGESHDATFDPLRVATASPDIVAGREGDTLLVKPLSPPIERRQNVPAVSHWSTDRGTVMVDFGQNLVGWVKFRARGARGAKVLLGHAEVLFEGRLATEPLRLAKAIDSLVLSGGIDHFEPKFTFHGFRFVELSGAVDSVDLSSLKAVVVQSALTRTGAFECSNPLLNKLHQNIVWGLRGNTVGIPTDCPQRDERMGWTGDISVFAPTACFLYDMDGFLRDWLRDLAFEQSLTGHVPFVVPNSLKFEGFEGDPEPVTTAIWADAAVWVPWALYWAYGERSVLRDQFPSMLEHARRVEEMLNEHGCWAGHWQFGDWLDPDAPPEDASRAKADKDVVATASAYRTFRLLEQVANALEEGTWASEFGATAERIGAGFLSQYVSADGRIISDCQTVYTLAISFGLLDGQDNLKLLAGERLGELVRGANFGIATGFAGTPYILDALTATGHRDLAYEMLRQTHCPSWLYPLTMGATTVWERWDALQPDGTLNPHSMTSFNHYALGAVGDWMHRTILGITAEAPGYAGARIAPRPPHDITWAAGSVNTRSGDIRVEWRVVDSLMTISAEVSGEVRAVIVDTSGAEHAVDASRGRVEVACLL